MIELTFSLKVQLLITLKVFKTTFESMHMTYKDLKKKGYFFFIYY